MPDQPPKLRKTLSDADIVTDRAVSRRSLLSATGLGLGAAALAIGVVAAAKPAHAASDKANTYDNDSNDRRPSTDND